MIAPAQHIVNVSGGKDSTACYLLALERGRPFRAIMCDTGHESPVTMEYAATLHEKTGGPKVEVFRADFSKRIEAKRRVVETKWRREGVSEEIIARALAALTPTGNPFLDLCIWKGRFPSRKAQFCTEELKRNVADSQVLAPALASGGSVVQWIGVRREESQNRANTPMFRRYRHYSGGRVMMFAPLIHWTAADTFAIAKRHNVPPNPLYLQGMGRVGCFPCINCRKGELAQIASRYPEAIEIVAEWERVVAAASKRQAATFFGPGTTPDKIGAEERYPDIRTVAEWARTDRGGRQYNWMQLDELGDGETCSSQYGLCE
jgi:3'-phosphoadenosine 5'-phosphosulfate sulfotransferase (PAPS reductase)/FAD synthetase